MRRLLVVAFAAIAMVFTLSGPMSASAGSGESPAAGQIGALSWDCWGGSAASDDDSGGRDVWSRCERHSGEWVGGTFYAYGEILRLCDYWPNGYPTMAILDVAGFKPLTLVSRGSGTCYDHNLAYPEGLSVWLTVCTSEKIGTAECHTEEGGRT